MALKHFLIFSTMGGILGGVNGWIDNGGHILKSIALGFVIGSIIGVTLPECSDELSEEYY